LKKHAEDKLREAAKQYTVASQDAAEKAAFLRQLQSELQAVRTRCNLAESRLRDSEAACTELTSRSQSLDAALRERELQLTNVSAANSNSERQLITLKAREEELAGINERYKQQLTQLREKERKLEETSGKFATMEVDMKKSGSELDRLATENRSLKSRLFDSLENEKRLRAQHGGGGSVTGTDSELQAKVKGYEADLVTLRQALETKENENKELLTMCDDLLRQCQALQAKKGGVK